MLGDILLINDMHKEAAEAICKHVLEDLETREERYRYIVGISGESGSGKSELSHTLGKALRRINCGLRLCILITTTKYSPCSGRSGEGTRGLI